MRRFVAGDAYVRVRLVFGALFVVAGLVLLVRTFAAVGFTGAATPAYVLGGALVALGITRYRSYFAARSRR